MIGPAAIHLFQSRDSCLKLWQKSDQKYGVGLFVGLLPSWMVPANMRSMRCQRCSRHGLHTASIEAGEGRHETIRFVGTHRTTYFINAT